MHPELYGEPEEQDISRQDFQREEEWRRWIEEEGIDAVLPGIEEEIQTEPPEERIQAERVEEQRRQLRELRQQVVEEEEQ